LIRYILIIPLFLFVLLMYDAMIFTGIDMTGQLFSLHLISGASWSLAVGDALLILGVTVLYIELLKSTNSQTITIIEHILSMLVFIGFLVEFIVIQGAATTIFVILMLMSLLDVVAGFTITVSTARRDIYTH